MVTSIVIENGVTSIGRQAFSDFRNLATIHIADSVSAVGDAAFYECSFLTSITLPPAVRELSQGLFAGCTKLSSVIADGVTSIGDYAFQETAIQKYTLNNALTNLSPLAFFRSSVQAFDVEDGNSVYAALDGVLLQDQGKTLMLYPPASERTSYQIPEQVTKIGNMAFACNKNLVNIDLCTRVTSLGESAFQECRRLTAVEIPDSVTTVGDFTFYSCPSLQSVKFGNGLEETSYQMFRECSSLCEIDFGESLSSLYGHTFAYCTSLERVHLPENIKKIGNGCLANCENLTTFSSEALTAIPFQAFLNDISLTTVSFNEGLKKIYRSTFLNCPALETITLPESVTFVASRAFPETTIIWCKNPQMDPFGSNGYRRLDRVSVSGVRAYDQAYEVLKIVNEQRRNNGFNTLVMNETLLETAMKRAAEITLLFSHTRPDSSSCFDLSRLMYAENIAFGQSTPEAVMDSWMHSEGHRKNILTQEYTTIGIGCFQIDGRYYWVQCFGTGDDTADFARPENSRTTEDIYVATETFEEAANTSGTIWGELESYTYTFKIRMDRNLADTDTSFNAAAYIVNPGSGQETKIAASCLNWESSDPTIAVVKDGTVSTLSKYGNATIRVSTEEGYFRASSPLRVQANADGMPALPFVDVRTDHWYYDSISYVYYNDIMTGMQPQYFGAGEMLLRAHFAKILHRMNGEPSVPYDNTFPDVYPNQWYTDAILWANRIGVINGYSNTRLFGTTDPINREQMAVMMYRYAACQSYDLSTEGDYSAFVDASSVSDFAKDAMCWAVGNGIITGKDQGTRLDPQGNASRAECATIIMRFIEKYAN